MRLSLSGSTVRRFSAALAAGGLATLALFNGPVGAAGSTVPCSTRSQSQVFARWGDARDYFLMPDGGFETGNEWVLSNGASIVTGNETFYVRSSTDSKSLRLPSGATAESRTICVARGEESIRMFVKNPGVWGAYIRVSVSVKNPRTGAWAWSYWDTPSSALPVGWSPMLMKDIPATWGYDGTQDMTVTISTYGSAANWQIDDVYVDPFRST